MKQQNIKQLTPRIRQLLRRHAVKRAAFFGSVARGVATAKSDIDIVVELGKNKTLLDLIGLKRDLEEKLGKKVDVVTYGSLRPRFRERVLADEVPIL